jgi:hypothetical protein
MDPLRNVRDVAIIVLAIESIVIGGLLVFLVIQIQRLVKMLREEIKPILDSTNETVSTVRGTTTFVSRHVVSPLVEVVSFLSGVRRVGQAIVGRPKPASQPPADVSGAAAGQAGPAQP